MTARLAGRVGCALVVAVVAVLSVVPTVAVADTVAVEVTDDGFAPTVVTAVVGDTVQWTWTGQGQHGVRAQSGEFDSHPGCSQLTPLQCGGPGSTFSHTVSGPARTISYTDPATGAAGRIIVEEASPEPSPEPSPTEEPSPEPSPTEEPSPEPSPTEEPSPEPSPTEEPSPEPTQEPSPEPTQDPSPSPSPTSSPSPEPTSTFTFGPPPPRETAPPVVVSPSATPTSTSTRPRPTLEPFPSFDPNLGETPMEDGSDGEVFVAVPDDPDDPMRTPALVLAAGALAATLVAFGRLVLFGPPW